MLRAAGKCLVVSFFIFNSSHPNFEYGGKNRHGRLGFVVHLSVRVPGALRQFPSIDQSIQVSGASSVTIPVTISSIDQSIRVSGASSITISRTISVDRSIDSSVSGHFDPSIPRFPVPFRSIDQSIRLSIDLWPFRSLNQSISGTISIHRSVHHGRTCRPLR